MSGVTCADDDISGTVSVTVENQGCVAAANFQVSLNGEDCVTFANQTVTSLAAGASTTQVFTISDSWGRCADCSLEFTAEVDPSDEVCERTGDNNRSSETHSPDLPNLA